MAVGVGFQVYATKADSTVPEKVLAAIVRVGWNSTMSSPRVDELKALGLSNIHIAILMNRPRWVVSLLAAGDQKEIIKVRDAEGATPLMLAVLMGRLAIVNILLRNKASTRAKDNRGYRAIDYTRTSLFQKRLSAYHRLGLGSESKKQRSGRLTISKMLRYPASLRSSRQAGSHKYSKAFLYKHRGKLHVLRPDTSFAIAKRGLETSTVGFIASATCPTVTIAAVSGWQPNPTRNGNVLDSSKYTQLVRDVAQLLGFELGKHFRDRNGLAKPEDRGRFFASHIEKKLAVFWVVATLKATIQTTDYKRMAELRETIIPERLRTAKVFLDHDPCRDCLRFLDLIRSVTGLTILFERRPFLTNGKRKRGCAECPCARCQRIHHPPQSQRHGSGRVVAELNGAEEDSEDLETGTAPEVEQPNNGNPAPDRNRLPHEPPTETTQARIRPTSGPRNWRTYQAPHIGEYQRPSHRPLAKKSAREVLEAASDEVLGGYSQLMRPRPQTAPSLQGQTSNLRGPASRIEVQLPGMDAQRRAEFDRVSVSTRNTSPRRESSASQTLRSAKKQSKKNRSPDLRHRIEALNLKRFAYNGPGSGSATARSAIVARVNASRVPRVRNEKGTKGAAKTRSARSTRNEKFERRSIFARVAKHHRRH
ncbi:hypothetical protein VTK26DRAFT_4306 [Humicola hyalothermophila]